MIVTGGASNNKIPRLRAWVARLDCAAAVVLHMAHPWAKEVEEHAHQHIRTQRNTGINLLILRGITFSFNFHLAQ